MFLYYCSIMTTGSQHVTHYTLFWIQPLRAKATKVYLF